MRGQFTVAVAGVSYPNDDGSSRQDIIRDCREGENLELHHVPVPQDKYAVKVSRWNGEQLGWLPKWNAREIAPLLDRGDNVEASIYDIKESSRRPINCILLITKPEARKAIESKRTGCIMWFLGFVAIAAIIIVLIAQSC